MWYVQTKHIHAAWRYITTGVGWPVLYTWIEYRRAKQPVIWSRKSDLRQNIHHIKAFRSDTFGMSSAAGGAAFNLE